jgi:hypothetical protein
MVFQFDPGALLGRFYPLEDGSRISLRVARPSDANAIRRLLESVSQGCGDLEVARLVNFDPRRRCVICATGLLGGSEHLVGVGSVELGERAAQPEMVVVDPSAPAAVGELLAGALVGRATALAAARAA